MHQAAPPSPRVTYLPEDDTGITGTSEGTVVQPAAVETPDLVLMGIQSPHTLVILDGPEL